MGISMPSRYCENDYHVGNGDQYKNGKPNQWELNLIIEKESTIPIEYNL